MTSEALAADALSPEDLAERIVRGEGVDALRGMAALAAWLRPADPAQAHASVERIRKLTASLQASPAARERIRAAIRASVAISAGAPLFAESGILSRRGFVAEIFDRVYERVLPTPLRNGDLRDTFERMFDRPADGEWVEAVPAQAWAELALAVDAGAPAGASVVEILRPGILGACEILAVRIAAEGTETELLHVDPEGARHDSPFLALQREVASWLGAVEAAADAGAVEAPAHAHVLLAQCLERVARLRGIGRRRGTSVRITYLLERMEQQLRRLELLLRGVEARQGSSRADAVLELFRSLVQASAARLSVGAVWEANTRLLSKRVTENASRAGEHYATSDAAGYYAMMRSAMGAGILIALMALLKIQIKGAHLAPLVEAALVCADYALGFVVIFLLHFTVATKQPAMTAAMIAATVEEAAQSRRAPLDGLARLIASVMRTQLVAIFGNIALALPLAMAIASAYAYFNAQPLLGPAKVHSMLWELQPVMGFALLHAAIAGVWLFAAGLVSGWYDNRCAVLDIPERLRGSPLLQWLPASWRERLAAYVDGNLGGLMGNVVFGILLGATGFVGLLLGLPIDIRHVAFASANLGFAAVSADLAAGAFAIYFAYVLMIGTVNLLVSFSLALNVAMRARNTTFARAGELARELLALLAKSPREFFLPPRTAP